MKSSLKHGMDYTPLFQFLLSRVGYDWDETYREAVARLDRPDPIFWIVAKPRERRCSVVRVGESTYFSGLYVDEENKLARVDPNLSVNDLKPSCSCCTHTFNGQRFTQPFLPRHRI